MSIIVLICIKCYDYFVVVIITSPVIRISTFTILSNLENISESSWEWAC